MPAPAITPTGSEMPPATRARAFLIVFSVLCLISLAIVLLAEFSSYQWAKRAMTVAQNFSLTVLACVGLSFILVEGVPLMLAAWYRKEIIKEAEDRGIQIGLTRGHAEGRAEGFAEGQHIVLEAERQRREGETLEQALARLLIERANRP